MRTIVDEDMLGAHMTARLRGGSMRPSRDGSPPVAPIEEK
jgi:hypothetical protein